MCFIACSKLESITQFNDISIFVAELHPTESLSQAHVMPMVANTLAEMRELLAQLDCAQCRLNG